MSIDSDICTGRNDCMCSNGVDIPDSSRRSVSDSILGTDRARKNKAPRHGHMAQSSSTPVVGTGSLLEF